MKESGVYVYACVKTTAAKPRELILNHYLDAIKAFLICNETSQKEREREAEIVRERDRERLGERKRERERERERDR